MAQLNVDDLSATDIDKLNLCALEFKISAGYFGRLAYHYNSVRCMCYQEFIIYIL